MPLGNAANTVSDMFDDLKSKLGFGHEDDRYDDRDHYDDRDQYDEYDRYDDRDDYDDRGNYENRSNYDDSGFDRIQYDDNGYDRGGYDSYEGDYSDRAPVGGFRPASPYGNRFNRNDISSSLVSIDDVKAATPLPDRLQRDPIATVADNYAARTEARDYAEPASYTSSAVQHDAGARPASFDPYEAYSGSSAGVSAYTPTRKLTVVKPVAYGDVERVARAVKSGDVVVLGMRNTPDDLSKRILDFSFGVASALDANVECPGDKVFAIARGNALTEAEKTNLRNQGVL